MSDVFDEPTDARDDLSTAQPIEFGPLAGDEFVGVQGMGDGEAADAAVAAGDRNLELLLDVSIPISVEVGATSLSLDGVLKLVPGSIVTLDKKVEEPVDLLVNGKLIARGEVVMVDDSYGLRITEIVDASQRLQSLR